MAIPLEKPKMFPKDAEIDVNVVVKKLNEIVAARGVHFYDRIFNVLYSMNLLFHIKKFLEVNCNFGIKFF